VYEPVLTLAERLALARAQREAEVEASASAAPPAQDAMFHPKDWPVDARVWFYKAGINNDDIDALGAFWSPRMRRIVVPYRTVSGVQAWIARDPWHIKGVTERPKYLFPEGVARGGGAVFRNPARAAFEVTGVVVVEDVLSAHRIAKDTDLLAVAAQGTTLDRAALVGIANLCNNLRVSAFTWLDPDRYGQLGAARIRDHLGNMGVPTRNVLSERDPKLHEPHEIREALEC
jgi:hypothetical protein